MNDQTNHPQSDRDALRMKIEAAERRIAERTLAEQAQEAAQATTTYVKANPLKVIGGAIAVGLLIGLMTRPGRRAATTAANSAANAVGGAASDAAKGVSDAAKAKTSKYGPLIADAIVAYGIRLIDEATQVAQKGQDKLQDLGDSANASARDLRREASYIAAGATDKGRVASRKTRRRAERVVRDLTKQVSK